MRLQRVRHAHRRSILLPFQRAAGVLCALALCVTTIVPAYADEHESLGRLKPSTRGGRTEANQAPSTAEAAPAPAPAAEPPPPPQPSVGDQIANLASSYIGSRYVFGGASPATGFDCSGLVQWVLSQVGLYAGRVVVQQYAHGQPVPGYELQPGDLVFFANTYMPGLSHVGIYVGNGAFVDAGTERSGVRRARLSDPYWESRYVGARRLQ